MKKNKILAAAAAVLIIILIPLLFSSDEDKIKSALKELENGIEKTGKEGVYGILSKAEKVGSLFTEDCSIEIRTPKYSISGKQKLIQDVAAALKFAADFNVGFADISVTVNKNSTAKTLMTVTGNAPGEGSISPFEVEMTWKKVEGKWLIEAVKQNSTTR